MAGKKILIISYYWPPSGGAGVQRWLKLSKYLPKYGWEPIILTIDPQYAEYPAYDPSLEKDIVPGLRVVKTKARNYFRISRKGGLGNVSAGFASGKNSLATKVASFVRGNFFIPDPRRGWNKFAIREAREIIASEKIEHFITTSPPHSTQLIGLKLKKIFPGLKWICDLRDPWTDIYYYSKFYGTALARHYDQKLENKVLRRADKIITVGDSLAELFSGKTEGLDKKISVVSNGFDEDDFRKKEVRKIPGRTVITYVGTMSDQYPFHPVLDALVDIFNSDNARGSSFLIRLVGYISPGIKQNIDNSVVSHLFEFIPYSSHHDSINYMLDSDMLLLLIPVHSKNKLIITGKLFEYIRSGKTIICVGPPDGDAARIINKTRAGFTFDNDQKSGIKYLLEHPEQFSRDKSEYSRYSHQLIAKHLVLMLG